MFFDTGTAQEKIKKLEILVKNLLDSKLPHYCLFHTFKHALDVRNSCLNIIKEESIPPEEVFILEVASLVHDLGYTVSQKDHEQNSIKIAMELFAEIELTDNQAKHVKQLILATSIPQHPKNQIEEIICDADLDFLGRDDFWELSDKLFSEYKYFNNVSQKEWNYIQINFFKSHRFFTIYSKKHRLEKKIINFNLLLKNNFSYE